MVACVATALTADRLAAAAPVLRPQVLDVARQITRRLVVSFRQTIPAIRVREYHREGAETPLDPAVFIAEEPTALPFGSTPSLYRLPPPLT